VGSIAERLTADDAARARVATMQRELEEARSNAALWGQMHDLIGTNNGDRFRDIAMGWAFRDIVVRASARLTTLLPRYGLRVVEDEHGLPGTDLSVIDHFSSDMQRPLSTLSGGETFCVSLAMALALAASRQTGVRIETLLLDEGFGTLDPDSLQLVLRALHTVQEESNAQLGLISHVQGLQEQITHRIHVRRTIGNRSEIVVG
jgi:exonuclease SbcC